jgi:putative transposase
MAYSTNPYLIKTREVALKKLLVDHWPLQKAANYSGVHRTTLWRWRKRWEELNCNVKTKNYNRPSRPHTFKEANYCWKIPTLVSAPKTHPGSIAQLTIDRILAIRAKLNRCAVVIQAELLKEQTKVSVSTIKRVIAKYALQKTKRRKIKRTLPRPDTRHPGDLVQIDTVHYVDRLTGERRYIFTVIDLFSRMSYALCFDRMLPGNALRTVLAAERYFGFNIKVLQSDNGPEFSKWFTAMVEAGGYRTHRHTRIHRPNDNAHIERFNRTLREECIGDHMSCRETTEKINEKLGTFIDFYNYERLHLGLQCRVPVEMLRR